MNDYSAARYYDETCIFCKIIRGDIPSDKVFENEHVLVINDINPKAPIHFLIIPKPHLTDILELDDFLMKETLSVVKHLAKEHGLDERGFNLVNNCGADAGQSVFHVHFHLLSGKAVFNL